MKIRPPRWILIVAAFVAVYALVGFLVLPPIVRSQLEKRLAAETGRPVKVERVRINPFAMSLAVEGLDVRSADGTETFLAWKRLYANFEPLKSILKTWVLGDVELDEFRGALAIREDGTLSIADILARLEQREKSPDDGKPGRAIRVVRLRVSDGRLDFTDASHGEVFRTSMGPVNFSLVDFRTTAGEGAPYSFSGVTEAGEKLEWRGTLSSAPLASQGDLRVEQVLLPKYAPYFQSFLNGRLESGRLSVNGHYDVRWDAENRRLRFSDGNVKLEELRILDAQGEAVAHLSAAEVTGIDADGMAMKAHVARAAVSGGRARVQRERDGMLNLIALVKTPASGSSRAPSSPASSASPAASPTLDLVVDEVSAQGLAVEFTDLTLPAPAVVTLQDMRANVGSFTLAPDAKMPVTFAFDVQSGGTFELKGEFGLKPLAAEANVEARSIALAPFSPFLGRVATAEIADGALSLSGHASLTSSGSDQPAFAFTGDVRMENVGVLDRKSGEPLAGFGRLAVSGIHASITPALKLSIAGVTIDSPFAHAVIDEQGSLNFTRAMQIDGEPSAPPPATSGDAGKGATPVPPIEIEMLSIGKGDFSFTDRSVAPPVKMAVKEFETTLKHLSSQDPGRGLAQLRAQVNGAAPIVVGGELDPLAPAPRADLKAVVQSVDLKPISPYVEKFAGYELARGRLFVDADAKLADNRLDMGTRITLEQFTLGGRVESPDATHLPVRLGVALLKDREGKIVLNIPVSGSLQDPSFDVGQVITGVVTNLLAKAATSPFSLLGSMFGGGGDELGRQEFLPGSVELTPESRQRAQVLQRALTERPALNLEIAGGYNAEADRPVLQREKVNQLVQQRAEQAEGTAEENAAVEKKMSGEAFAEALRLIFNERFPPGTEPGAPPVKTPEVRPQQQSDDRGVIRRVWDLLTFKNARDRHALERARNEAQAEREPEIAAAKNESGLPIEEMIGRLAQATEITPEDFARLAEARAARVRDVLINEGKIAAERLTVVKPDNAAAARIGAGADLQLY